MEHESLILDRQFLEIIAMAIEDAPVKYRANLSSACERERIRAADALAGWIGAHLRTVERYHDTQLSLPMEDPAREH
ncbi:DUF6771 family protein [Sphingomonas sp. YL-JM2C]